MDSGNATRNDALRLTTFISSISRSAHEASMYRMNSIRHGIIPQSPRRLKHVSPFRPVALLSRSLHSPPSSNSIRSSWTLRGYGRTVIATGLVVLIVYWAVPPPKAVGPPVLDQRRFQPFAIISKEPVSSNSSIYTLRPGSEHTSDPYAHLWARGIWSVQIKQPQLQIARFYTPLAPTHPPGVPGDLRFLIRREQNGEVSTYLDRLRIGAAVEVRGPKVEYEVPEGVSEVLFLAGGTGIAPALQVACTLLNKRAGDLMVEGVPKVHILWANRRSEDCAGGQRTAKSTRWGIGRLVADDTPPEQPTRIVRELQDLETQFEGRVKVEYIVDEEGGFIRKSDVLRVTSGNAKSDKGPNLGQSGTKLLLVSGPDGFVEFYAGPKEWENGKLGQGRLGGLLGSLELNDWTVVKL